ncbi:NAD-dependent epimerase/dehydratase family protein [Chondromyces crocatus]|uniref:NAD-dependent epimerase n=1 Tax=Chondromyces crocatus TaxID=52 RepID=A0A0K1EKN4_CHOCO|nr:NAD-dependent epimerase/dehydratase family protein [Chondromyces crocatus]AKT41153.1 NAD-dependent epimerase [Chondromyces crocatus]
MGVILITGFAGGLARDVAGRLVAAGHGVVGVDYREAPPMDGVTLYRASYDKTAIEDVFRKHAFDAVLHLGRVGNLSQEIERRFELNVLGTQKILNLCRAHGVGSLVVLSTFHIYGAHPRNHTPISEADPLRAGYEFPEIADAIQLDNMATTWIYQHPEVRVVVLRPTNVVGPSIRNSMSSLLRLPRVPHLAGFNPMTQFIHQDDLGAAIEAAMKGSARGVFNVTGDDVVPWRTALDLAGARSFPIPSSLVTLYLKTISAFPEYLVNFFKFPCVLTGRAFRETFGWSAQIDLPRTLASTREQRTIN